ncbi:MAG: HAD family hydrolase [Oscillospiraceae bacterium]|nr:HAD family hydrolase [Oscillospiraceae bacterium]
MKTLYISDLDGTLLNSEQKLSAYTINVVKRMIDRGEIFSYATARSLVTAQKVTEELTLSLPVICYNGAFIFDNETREVLYETYFSPADVHLLREFLYAHNITPIVYSFVDGKECFSFIEKSATAGVRDFLDSRIGDSRWREAEDEDSLYAGKVFYITCIDSDTALAPVIHRFKSDTKYQCVAGRDIYSGELWCELLPHGATKANAAMHLKRLMECGKLVAFGDGINDLPLFENSDECYAVANSVEELKAKATAVIGSNNDDGVAKWLEENVLGV